MVEVTRVFTQEVVVTATPTPPAACAAAGDPAATEAVVGVLAPFSQNAAWPKALGMQAGIGLAVEDINQAGGVTGKPLRAAIADTAGDPALAARLAESLITEDCASALVGGFTLEESAAIRQVSELYGVPFIIVEATADELTSDSPATVFRIAPAATMLAQMPAQWFNSVGDFNGDGTVHVTLIVENTPNGDKTLEQTIQALTAANIPYDFLRVDVPTQDFSPQIARIVASEQTPDAIFVYVGGDLALTVLRQLLDAGISPQKGTLLVAGRSALDGELFWQLVPDGAYTVVSRRGPWNTSLTPMGQGFVERYRQYSSQWPEPVAFAAYDAIHLLADAAQRSGSMVPKDLLNALETTDVTLASGYYHFPFNSQRPPNGQLEPAYLWHQWPDPPLLYMQYREPLQDPATIDIIWPPLYRTVEDSVIRP
jgi:branched-chain amino acid transport system substrate-binding protein